MDKKPGNQGSDQRKRSIGARSQDGSLAQRGSRIDRRRDRPRSDGSSGRRSLRAEPAAESTAPVKVGDELTVTVERLGYRGEGVARHEGFALFVDGALPGEHVKIHVTHVARSFAHAHLREIITASATRTTPPCPVYDLCGGCQLQHLAYPEQLKWKRQAVVDALVRIGKFAPDQVEDLVGRTLGMEEPWRYRNKVQVAAAQRGGRFVVGFVEEGTHEPVEADECLIRPQAHDRLLELVLEVMAKREIHPYDEGTGQGDVRGVMIRTTRSGDALVVVTTAGKRLPHATEFAAEFATRVASKSGAWPASALPATRLAGVVHQPAQGASRALWGVPYVDESILGLTFRVSADSFLQVNSLQTERLYTQVLHAAQLVKTDIVWDVYCGIGTLALLAATQCRRVVGIEEVEQAVEDARYNGRANGLERVSFWVGRAETAMAAVMEEEGRPDVVLLDPPRAGCAPEVIAALLFALPRRIVYVSCNPATLARDLRILADRGYVLESAQPVDMFAQTAHVECVVGLVNDLI